MSVNNTSLCKCGCNKSIINTRNRFIFGHDKRKTCFHGISPKKLCKICERKLQKIRSKRWVENHPKQYKTINKKYNEKHKERIKKWHKKHPKERKMSRKKWKNKHPDEVKSFRDRRRKSVSHFTLIPVKAFPEEISMVGHHINYMFKVAIPKNIHLKCSGGPNTSIHRQKCSPFLNKIYDVDFIKDLY